MAIPTRRLYSIGALSVVATVVGAISAPRLLEWQGAAAQGGAFRLEEATIADVHRAIHQAQITCRDLVRAYVDRARAYNGVSDRLVTVDGALVTAIRRRARSQPAHPPGARSSGSSPMRSSALRSSSPRRSARSTRETTVVFLPWRHHG